MLNKQNFQHRKEKQPPKNRHVDLLFNMVMLYLLSFTVGGGINSFVEQLILLFPIAPIIPDFSEINIRLFDNNSLTTDIN